MHDGLVKQVVAEQPHRLLFATISGAHLYGFASLDSDVDVRGVHILPVQAVVGLERGPETIEQSTVRDGIEIDLVTHDLVKFAGLMLKRNGYVMEQLYSSLIVQTTPEHDELQAIGRGCLTRHHAHHYLGFAAGQWKRCIGEHPRRVKPLLYVYRVLLTGIHLMRTGQVEADIRRLNEVFNLLYLADLIATKQQAEQATLADDGLALHEQEYQRLRIALSDASAASQLPEHPMSRPALHDFVVRVRLSRLGQDIHP